jgi:hypothetical protein
LRVSAMAVQVPGAGTDPNTRAPARVPRDSTAGRGPGASHRLPKLLYRPLQFVGDAAEPTRSDILSSLICIVSCVDELAVRASRPDLSVSMLVDLGVGSRLQANG